MNESKIYPMIAKTMSGLEHILAEELINLGATDIEILPRAVAFRGDKALMYTANLWCRTALRILKPISKFKVSAEKNLYDRVFNIKWEDYLDVNKTFAIDTVITNSIFTNSLYVSQKVKDAIADRFYFDQNKRPSVNLILPDLKINVHIHEEDCTISLDSSGNSLHKRGYRQATGLAPINEVLAAGLILLSGWNKDCNFIDPMCGSGTFLIEAALIANNIPPGNYRFEFGFEKWNDFDAELWKKIKLDAIAQQSEFEFEILGSDISEESIQKADENIRFAHLHKDINIKRTSFDELIPPEERGIVIMNPPYGERLKEEEIIELYKSIGDNLKRKYAGYQAWVISSDMQALKFIGLKPSKKIKMFNGPLECLYVKFELYEGSKKMKKNN